MNTMTRLLTAVLALLLGSSAVAAVPDDMKALVDAGNHQAAYTLGTQNLDEYEGDPIFDFNFGLAALESGHYSDAVFALERVLLRFPDQQRVRLELARAHFGSGNLAAARREFQTVLDTDPPARVKQNINAFMARIDQSQRGQAKQQNLVLFAETAAGYDSNVNSATDDATVQLPIGVVVNLDKAGTEIDDGFVRVGAGAVYQAIRSPTSGYDVAGVVSRRELWSGDDFDLTFAQIAGGYTIMRGDHRIRFGARGLMVGLDTSRFQDQLGVSIDWNTELGSGYRVFAGFSAALITYDDDPLRDTNQFLLNAGATRKFGITTHTLRAFGALEPAQNGDAGEHNGRDFGGIAYRADWLIRDRIAPYLRAQAQWTKYDQDNPVFAKTRDESLYSVSAGATWKFLKNWLARGQVSYANQDSNVDVFDYDRFQFEAGVTYTMPR